MNVISRRSSLRSNRRGSRVDSQINVPKSRYASETIIYNWFLHSTLILNSYTGLVSPRSPGQNLYQALGHQTLPVQVTEPTTEEVAAESTTIEDAAQPNPDFILSPISSSVSGVQAAGAKKFVEKTKETGLQNFTARLLKIFQGKWLSKKAESDSLEAVVLNMNHVKTATTNIYLDYDHALRKVQKMQKQSLCKQYLALDPDIRHHINRYMDQAQSWTPYRRVCVAIYMQPNTEPISDKTIVIFTKLCISKINVVSVFDRQTGRKLIIPFEKCRTWQVSCVIPLPALFA